MNATHLFSTFLESNQTQQPESSAPKGHEEGRFKSVRSLVRGLSASRHTADRTAAVILTVVGLLILNEAIGYGLFPKGQPGPGLFPAIIAGGLVLLSLLWLLTGAGKTGIRSSVGVRESDALHVAETCGSTAAEAIEHLHEDEPEIDKAGARTIAFAIFWALVPLTLLDVIGLVLTMTIYVGGMLVVVAKAKYWIALPATAAISLLTGIGLNALGIVIPDPLNLLSMLGG